MRFCVTVINWGPNHPAAHGVMRLLVELMFEIVINVDLHLGLLHRATEKLIEMKVWIQVVGFFDRLDYVSSVVQEEVFICSLEVISECEFNNIFRRIFVIELMRVVNHWLVLGCHAGDMGAVSFILWFFEDRERVFELIERITGARMHSIYFRLFRVSYLWSNELLDDVYVFLVSSISRIDDCFDVMLGELFRLRLCSVFVLGLDEVLLFSFSGVLCRACGISWDLRVDCDFYYAISFVICYSSISDSFDRLLIRISEVKESLFIVFSMLLLVVIGFESMIFSSGNGALRWLLFSSMELVINCFFFGLCLFIELLEFGVGYFELPKGEFININLLIESLLLFRNRIRSVGFLCLSSFIFSVKGLFISDLVVAIGTIDVVFGEVDR